MTEKLLPCPFCGGAKLEVSNKTTTISYVRKRHVAVYCKKCNTYGPRIIADETGYPEFCTEEAKQEAIAAWNRRAQPENKPLTCDGCECRGEYENEVEYGYPSPCTACQRRAVDNYRHKPEEGLLC